MIPAGTRLLLVDSYGKKFVVKAAKQMLEVGGLGVVDGVALCDANFGDRMRIGGRDFIILKPSTKDLLGIIERRAQIMIPKDSFLIPMHLDLSSGSRVIEGGVGSGALTIVLLKAVSPSGKVYSYETRTDYADIARRNVALSDNEAIWHLKIDDVCRAQLEQNVDAVVVDIPNPWDAVENATKALKAGGYFCCYVPNVNQLENAVRKMREIGLAEIVAFETLHREMVVHEGGVRPSFDMLGHTGYLALGRKMLS